MLYMFVYDIVDVRTPLEHDADLPMYFGREKLDLHK